MTPQGTRVRLFHEASDLLDLLDVIEAWAARRGMTLGEVGALLAEAARRARPGAERMMAAAMEGRNPPPPQLAGRPVLPPAMD